MSSPPNQLYKSRLFNFLNRKSLRLKEQLSQTGRQAKTALEWGVQILVYPLYLLVQTGRMAERQLKQTVTQPFFFPGDSSVEPVSCDQPINHITETVTLWLLNESESESIPNTIQAIATTLDSRELVVINEDNQPLDILSNQQKARLIKELKQELAYYQYQRRLEAEVQQKYPGLVSSFIINSPTVIPPVRWFWTVMRWVQTGSVAIAINLFEESKLIQRYPSAHQIASSHPESLETLPETELIESSDTLDNPVFSIKEIRLLIEAAIDHFFGKPVQNYLENDPDISALEKAEFSSPQLAESSEKPPSNLVHTVSESIGKLVKATTDIIPSSQSQKSVATSEPDPFQIQILIQAAIDYFFGQQPRQTLGDKPQQNPNLNASVTSPTLPLETVPDPWLSWEDLYSKMPLSDTQEAQNRVNTSPSLPSTSKRPNLPKSNLRARLKQRLTQEQKPKAITQTQPEPKQLIQPEKTVKKVVLVATENKSIVLNSLENNQVEASPEWIETEVKSVDYIKHPLVIILEGLDRIILWGEEQLLKLWQWIKNKF